MRFITIIFFFGLICFSCVKKQTKNPIPSLTYESFTSWKVGGRDTAIAVLNYADGDGDIFRDASTSIPNLIIKFYYYNSGTHNFTGYYESFTSDTFNIAYIIHQPGDGFKGKSIQGDITIPMKQFRPADSVKIFKYKIFAVDEAGHNSNVITTPQFTVNY